MGDMGQRNKSGGKKRIVRKRGRSDKGRDLLAWLPDGYRKESPAKKLAVKRWLAGSFVMSNPSSVVLKQKEAATDMTHTMAMLASSVANGAPCEITISSPEPGNPYWESDMSMVIDGFLVQTVIESLDANDLMTASIGWVNQVGTR